MTEESSATSLDPNPLHLAPDPSAARDARAWVAGALAGWPRESVETARLLVSELVTNSVLHAGTVIAVAYRLEAARARFDVTEGHESGPVPKRYAPDSPTGRGMRLVAALADEWGVKRDRRGKTVWFTVSPSTRAGPRLDVASVAAGFAGNLRDMAVLVAPKRRGQRGPTAGHDTAPDAVGDTDDTVEVLILGLPLDVYVEAEQHNDAVLRELTLIVQSAASPSGVDVPRRLVELANEVRATFSPATRSLRDQVEDAVLHRRKTVDIHMSVPRTGWQALLRLAEWLDEVDRYCEQGDLLTLASSLSLRRFRAWYVGQVVSQMHGRPPTPWGATPPG